MGQITNNFPTLLENDGADTNEWTYNGTKGGIQFDGVFNGATVVVQVSLNGGTNFHTDSNSTSTAVGPIYFSSETPEDALYRFFVSNAGGSTAIIPTLTQDQG